MKNIKIGMFMNKIKERSLVFNNLKTIFEKGREDKNMDLIFETINSIFQKEINYAIEQISKLDIINQETVFDDILTKNIYVYKENLKLILKTSGKIKS